MSSFKRKKLRVDFQFLLVPGLSEQGECPGMSPSRGKYLACQSCERAPLKKRKEMRDPLICLSTQLWTWKKCSYLTHTTLDSLWCVCVCADNSSACVCEEWTAEQRVQVDCCLLWTWLFPFAHLCEKYSTTLFNLSRGLLSRHAAALLTKCLTFIQLHTLELESCQYDHSLFLWATGTLCIHLCWKRSL